VKQEHGLRNFSRSRNSGKTGERQETRAEEGKKRRRKNRKIINVIIIAFKSVLDNK
jgi:hypothetical protein